MLAINNST